MDAENIKNGADQYALESLMILADQLERIIGQVRNGIRMLEEKRPAAPPPAETHKE